MNTNAFEFLLDSISITEFMESHWEKDFLHLQRANADYYSSLFQLEDMDSILSSRDIRLDQCRIVKSGKILAPSDFAKNIGGIKAIFRDQIADTNKIFDLYAEGSTIIFESIDTQVSQLSLFCRNLEKLISHKVQINAYLTPKESQGFPIHHDTHDVFILQIFGSKKWKLYDSPIPLPMPHQGHANDIPKTHLREELTLNQGDLLYIPRGVQHEAMAAHESSLHLTVGVNITTWSDIVIEAIKLASKRDISLRKSLPIGFGSFSDETFYYERIAWAVDCLRESLLSSNGDICDWLRSQYLKTTRAAFDGRLRNFERANAILNIDSKLKIDSNLMTSMRKEADEVLVSIQNSYLNFPARAEKALDFILNTSSFRVREIPDLNDADRLIVSQKFVQEGLAIIE
jgi:hypothetical protein